MLHTKDAVLKKYLEVKVERPLRHQYFLDGQPIEKEVLGSWLKPSKDPTRQQLEKCVILRDYTLDNIRQIDGIGGFFVVESTPMSVSLVSLPKVTSFLESIAPF